MIDLTREAKFYYVQELMRRDWINKNMIYAMYNDTEKMIKNNAEYQSANEALIRRFKTGK